MAAKTPRTPQIFTDALLDLYKRFLRDEAIGGKLIVLGAALSLLVVNTSLVGGFQHVWETSLRFGLGGFGIQLSLHDWVNEGLMAVFFLVVGFEIKKEIVHGELRKPSVAILPVIAALGGMLVPALLYAVFNAGQASVSGWGIPMATDIAFAVAVMSLLGDRVPSMLKLMLLTLAIADDIGAIIVIALFYAHGTQLLPIALALGLIAALAYGRHWLGKSMFVFLGLGCVLWVLLHLGGVHASIAGAILGLLAPVSRGHMLTERLERFALPLSTFVVLPIFAFANAGVPLSFAALTAAPMISLGIVSGLVVGKVTGIFLATWVIVKLGIAQLPRGITWRHILGLGMLAGIGFTVSLFIAGLAFTSDGYENAAKLSVLIGSLLSAGLASLFFLHRPARSSQS